MSVIASRVVRWVRAAPVLADDVVLNSRQSVAGSLGGAWRGRCPPLYAETMHRLYC